MPDSPRLPTLKSARCIDPPLPPHTPVALPTSSAIRGAERRALADGMAMAAVIAGEIVAVGQRHAGANHLRLLADRGVDGAGDLATLDHL